MKRALIFYASVAVIIAAAVVLIPHFPAHAEPNSRLRARIFTNSRNVVTLPNRPNTPTVLAEKR